MQLMAVKSLFDDSGVLDDGADCTRHNQKAIDTWVVAQNGWHNTRILVYLPSFLLISVGDFETDALTNMSLQTVVNVCPDEK